MSSNTTNDEEKLLLEKWFLIQNISSGTQDSYIRAIKAYTNLLGKNLSELLPEAKDENQSQIEMMDRSVTLNLLQFKKRLKESVKAPGTVNLQYFAVISFYKAYQITLPIIRMDRGYA